MTFIPTEILCKIFGYLDDISDSGWTFVFNKNGHARFTAKSSSGIHAILQFKSVHIPRQVLMRIQEYNINGHMVSYSIPGIEYPYLTSKEIQERNHGSGYFCDHVCYSFKHPYFAIDMFAYMEKRCYYNIPEFYYQTGSVYNKTRMNSIYFVYGIGENEEDPNTVRIDITPPVESFLEYNGDYIGAENLMNSPPEEDPQDLLEIDNYDDIPELQMYM